ncbi:MAG: MarR family transcriptional regulator [Candidatus Omnitrophota bacterium]
MSSHILDFADKVSEIMPLVMREFSRRLGNELFKEKITLPQIFILDLLDKHGESRMSDLARLMKVSTAASTGIVERLVKYGYVARVFDPDDRRIIRIKLTSKGSVLIRNINQGRRRLITRIFGKISEEDRQDYLRILFQIKNILTQDNSTVA